MQEMEPVSAEIRHVGRIGLSVEQIGREQIAVVAYFYSLSPESGSDEENWLRAERELQSAPTKKPHSRKPRAKKPAAI
jgi:hypothetical protein